tara:strand:- start:1809 stop:1976 length:168 start_codon:yes stop_codon:yes gene_type:complete
MIPKKTPICLSCANYIGRYKCLAFDKIPKEIFSGENNHSEPLPNQDNDVIFDKET